MSNTELSLFCEQLSLTLSAGISATEGIRILLEESEKRQEKELLTDILEHLENYETLYDSLKATGLFPDYMLNMMRIGEETGTLDEVTASLSAHYEREEAITKSIKDAITYPIIMAAMMVVVILVLLVKVMPIFNQVYIQLGTELTGISRVLLTIGQVISRYSIPIVVAAAAVITFILIMSRSKKGRELSLKLAYKTGISRQTYDDIAAMRFAGGMTLTMRSGLDADRSLELVEALNDNPYFSKKISVCKDKMQEGADFTDAIFDAGIFSGSYARMITIGAKAGSLEQVMEKISSLYQDRIDTRFNNRLAKLEPTIVIVMSLIVGCILLSVMLPLMGIMSSI